MTKRDEKRRREKLAPSIRKAHRRVQWSWYASLVHGAALLALAYHLLIRSEPAWVLGGLCVVGAGLVPFLGRTAYRGNSFSAFLLLVSVVAPPLVSHLAGWSVNPVAWGLVLVPLYVLGLKGATGLRGRRASARR